MLQGSPWVYTYSHRHKMTTQQQPKGPKGPKIAILQPTHASLEVPTPGPYRGGRSRKREDSTPPPPPRLVRGSILKKKVEGTRF